MNPSSNHFFHQIFPWSIWIVSASFVLFQFLLQISPSVMIPDLIQTFHINTSEVGVLSSSFFYSYLIMQIPAGLLIDHFGARKIVTVGLLLCAIAIWIFTHTQQYAIAVMARILMGFACAPAVSASLTLASQWFYSQLFTLLAGLTESLGMLGGVVGQSFLSILVMKWGWQSTLMLSAYVAIFLAFLTFLIIRHRSLENQVESLTLWPHEHFLVQTNQVLKLPRVWINGLISGLLFAVLSSFSGLWAVPYLKMLYHISLPIAANASAMSFLGAAIGAPVLGAMAGYYAANKRMILILSTLLCLISFLWIVYFQKPPLSIMFVLLFIVGFSSSAYIIPFSLVRDSVPSHLRGMAMGFANMMCILFGAPLLQPFIGFILQSRTQEKISMLNVYSVADFQIAFLILPVCLLIALTLIFFVQRKLYAHDIYKDIFPG